MSIEVNPVQSAKIPGTLGYWADGTRQDPGRDVRPYLAASAINAGEVVRFNEAAASTVIGVEPVPAVSTNKCLGVALNSAAAGEVVKVACDIGWCASSVSTSIVSERAIMLSAATAGRVIDGGGAEATLAVTDIGVARSAVVDDMFGTGIDGVLVEFHT